MNKHCVFTSATDNYAEMAIVALVSCKKYVPNIDLFLYGTTFSQKSRELAQKNNVTIKTIDLSGTFKKISTYPIECFYWMYAPIDLATLGYKKSVYIDSDILCNKSFQSILNSDFGDFAGYCETSYANMFGSEMGQIHKLFNIQPNSTFENKTGIQSGIVFIDNISYKKNNTYSELVDIYKKCLKNNIPRKGDDSLFLLFQLVNRNKKYTRLSKKYNYIVRGFGRPLKNNNIIFFHFAGIFPKPFMPRKDWPWRNVHWWPYAFQYAHFRKKWQNLRKEIY